jgi:hypothetical protein
MNKVLIFTIVWVVFAAAGMIWPKMILPLQKWQMKCFGKTCGTELESDKALCRKIKRWYIFFFIVGLLVLSNVLVGNPK